MTGPINSSGVAAEFTALRPAGGFGLIMADPPWSFDNFSAKGEAKNPKAHYDCMSLGAIKDLPVGLLAGRDCLLWLWGTYPMWPQALEVLRAWGFAYVTGGNWTKRTVRGKDAFGTGYVLRTASEPFLIGKLGRPKTTRATRSTIVSYVDEDGVPCRVGDVDFDRLTGEWRGTITIEAKIREHSRKPDEGFEAAEALMPGVPKVEMFSRQTRPGWAGWGNETGKFDEAAE